MNECYKNKKAIFISEWYRGRVISVRRDSLEVDHSQSFYSCLKKLGERPEDYGYYKHCACCGRVEEQPVKEE